MMTRKMDYQVLVMFQKTVHQFFILQARKEGILTLTLDCRQVLSGRLAILVLLLHKIMAIIMLGARQQQRKIIVGIPILTAT